MKATPRRLIAAIAVLSMSCHFGFDVITATIIFFAIAAIGLIALMASLVRRSGSVTLFESKE